MDPKRHRMEPSAAAMRTMVAEATERLVRHLEALPEAPAFEISGAHELARSLEEGPPASGAPFAELMDLVFERALPTSFNNAGPGFLAYIPGGGLFESAVADLVANGINRYVTVWTAAPGLAQLEINVIRWFCELLGLPPGSGGFLSSGGSVANFSAVFTARRERLPENFLAGSLYVSSQVHHSVTRAAALAGFPAEAVRSIPVDGRQRMRIDALERTLVEDRRAGRAPFLLVGSAGTTNTGAIDDLEALADVAAREGLWFHVDAAYGGFFALTERGRKRMTGLARADSVTLDPHKGLFLPYGTGCLLVREQAALRRAHTVQADYMPPLQDDERLVDFCEISPELSRDFRGLRVWLPLKLYGFDCFRAVLDEKLDLAEWAYHELEAVEGVETLGEPELSLVSFRLRSAGASLEEENELNRELLRRINERKRVFLTETLVDGRFVLRICVLNFRTHLDRMELCLEDIRAAVTELRGAHAPAGRSS